ncbi:hypothetical protein B0H10DRAFT_1950396 [Mycena sp. CBHHK59/15]|nr:hypothetical protein B0H10DRAFT_1950396 [Mycena sp. CBHHK59/15]
MDSSSSSEDKPVNLVAAWTKGRKDAEKPLTGATSIWGADCPEFALAAVLGFPFPAPNVNTSPEIYAGHDVAPSRDALDQFDLCFAAPAGASTTTSLDADPSFFLNQFSPAHITTKYGHVEPCSTAPSDDAGPAPSPRLPSYSSPKRAYGQFISNLDKALGKMYCATESFIVEFQGQTRMLLFFATQKGEITTTRLHPRREDIQIFTFWRGYSGPTPGLAIDWITIQSVAQELPSDFRLNAWNVARVARSSGDSKVVIISPGDPTHFLTPHQQIEICLDLKWNQPYVQAIVAARAKASSTRHLVFSVDMCPFQELWDAFCDVVNDWYIVLGSALITLPTKKQFRLIDIYDNYLVRLAQSEEHAAVQASS